MISPKESFLDFWINYNVIQERKDAEYITNAKQWVDEWVDWVHHKLPRITQSVYNYRSIIRNKEYSEDDKSFRYNSLKNTIYDMRRSIFGMVDFRYNADLADDHIGGEYDAGKDRIIMIDNFVHNALLRLQKLMLAYMQPIPRTDDKLSAAQIKEELRTLTDKIIARISSNLFRSVLLHEYIHSIQDTFYKKGHTTIQDNGDNWTAIEAKKAELWKKWKSKVEAGELELTTAIQLYNQELQKWELSRYYNDQQEVNAYVLHSIYAVADGEDVSQLSFPIFRAKVLGKLARTHKEVLSKKNKKRIDKRLYDYWLKTQD